MHFEQKRKHHRNLFPEKFRMTSTVEDQERKDPLATGTESGRVVIGDKAVMKTALLSVRYKDKFYKTRALFDKGNTRTYITEDLEKLKVKPVRQLTFSVYSFLSTKAKKTTPPAVVEKAIMIKATVTPLITGLFKWMLIQLGNQRKIGNDYPLADTLFKNVETCKLGLLFGNDYYNEIIVDERKKIQDNLSVINSKLGWTISGRASQPISKSTISCET